MGDRKLKKLLAEQRHLMEEERVLLKLLNVVREQKHKLQIEEVQLNNILLDSIGGKSTNASGTQSPIELDTVEQVKKQLLKLADNDSPQSSGTESSVDMDSVEQVNKQFLKLGTSPLDDMVKGRFYAETDENEEEEEEEEEEDGGGGDAAVNDKGEPVPSCSK